MKFFILLVFVSLNSWSHDYFIQSSEATYVVSHLVKKVEGVSKELKGKMVCDKGECQFLVAIPVKSFISSDSNRDLNMLTILEAVQYPLITVKGNLTEAQLATESFKMKSIVEFHGVKKEYTLNVKKKGDQVLGDLTLLLEDHKVERPSLLTVKISNEVPVRFNVVWR